MSKLFRTIVGLAAVGAATAAGVAYYLKNSEVEDDFLDEFEDDDIDAEDGEREYVSLTPAAKEEEVAEEACEECTEEAAEETCEECTEEAAEETCEECTEEACEECEEAAEETTEEVTEETCEECAEEVTEE